MDIETLQVGNATILRVKGNRLDAAAAVQFKDAVREASATAQKRIILDLYNVDFMDSSGLGAVIGARKLLSDHQMLELAGLRDTVAKVFRLTRMDTLFTIHDDVPSHDLAPDGAADQPHAV